MIWFTGDTHFGHANILKYCNRPFSSIGEMDEHFIEQWNLRVRPNDVVYHLGDFMFAPRDKLQRATENILRRLNGVKILIRGNHDRPETSLATGWQSTHDTLEVKAHLGGPFKQRIVLFHYPLRSWNAHAHGSWMLHGHCHGNLSDVGGKILDVGVDVWDYAPVSIETIASRMAARDIVTPDHHVSRRSK